MKIRGKNLHLRGMEYSAFMQYREVLVIGGTGFVGAHVCRALIARGYLPRLLVREGSEARIPEDVRRNCRVTPGDVTIMESVENAALGTGAIVNLAGIIREDPDKGITFESLHVGAARHVVASAKRLGITRVVHMSALGARAGGPTGYFDTKGRAEEIVKGSGLEWTIFRPSVIFGPGDMFVNELARILRLAPVFPVPGDGKYLLQPVFAGDVARGFADAVARPETAGAVFDVAGPERLSYDELVGKIAAGLGRRLRRVHVPLSLLRPVVRALERYPSFPLTTEQLAMLLAGNTADVEPFRAVFGVPLLSLSRYISGGFKAPLPLEEEPEKSSGLPSAGDSKVSASAGPGKGREESFRKSA